LIEEQELVMSRCTYTYYLLPVPVDDNASDYDGSVGGGNGDEHVEFGICFKAVYGQTGRMSCR